MDNVPATRNCRQDRTTPSTSPNRSMHMMCREKTAAHPIRARSPVSSRMPPLMLRKYRPAQASATEIQSRRLVRRVTKKASTGTITIYMAVRKPALPTSTEMIANCCRLDATQRKKPHRQPPVRIRFTEGPGLSPSIPSGCFARCSKALFSAALRRTIAGTRTRAPR